ncbi:MAG: hypothetical protein JXA01_01060 [Dehalococcoidia bacterium]|nr:hypothetical protein [Dehalococcoidia bacterium]
MQRSILILIIILTSFLSPFIMVTPSNAAVSVNPLQGNVGSVSYVSGLTDNTTYVIRWDGQTLGSGTVPMGGSVSFSVPVSPRGQHSLTVENPASTVVLSVLFLVRPFIEVLPISGTADSLITVIGRGFAALESNIRLTYDTDIVARNITADPVGSFTAQFAVPVSARGNHLITAFGNITPLGEVAVLSFMMYPSIKISPSTGCVGTLVEAMGSGFAIGETGIRITFDGQTVKSGITADSRGSWSVNLVIPEASKGLHSLDASGNSTYWNLVPDIQFAVMASAFINPSSGYVGDSIQVIGKGFARRETNITITYDDIILKRGIQADDAGNWVTTLNIPASVKGQHYLGAYGDVTTSLNCAMTILTVQSKIVLSPKEGNVGNNITVTGTGFSPQQRLSLEYGGDRLNITDLTDSSGNFFLSFGAPRGKHGPINIVVSDSGGAIASDVFSMEIIPPPVPKLISPANNMRIGFVGSSPVTFLWGSVADPSGIYYTLEISETPGFNKTIFKIDNLTTTQYSIGQDQALPYGEYYWRVRAIDGANNIGDWSDTSLLKVSYMSLEAFLILVLVLIIIIVLAIVLPLALGRGKKKVSLPNS